MGRRNSKKIILWFASHTMDSSYGEIEREARGIRLMLRESDLRDEISLVTYPATRPADVMQALNKHKPSIVHFTGHGNASSLLLETNTGSFRGVPKNALVSLFETMGAGVQAVLLNSHYSVEIARDISQHVGAAIGVREEFRSNAGVAFSEAFYSALGYGNSIENSFDQGVVALRMHTIREEHIPVFCARRGVSPGGLFLTEVRRPAWQESGATPRLEYVTNPCHGDSQPLAPTPCASEPPVGMIRVPNLKNLALGAALSLAMLSMSNPDVAQNMLTSVLPLSASGTQPPPETQPPAFRGAIEPPALDESAVPAEGLETVADQPETKIQPKPSSSRQATIEVPPELQSPPSATRVPEPEEPDRNAVYQPQQSPTSQEQNKEAWQPTTIVPRTVTEQDDTGQPEDHAEVPESLTNEPSVAAVEQGQERPIMPTSLSYPQTTEPASPQTTEPLREHQEIPVAVSETSPSSAATDCQKLGRGKIKKRIWNKVKKISGMGKVDTCSSASDHPLQHYQMSSRAITVDGRDYPIQLNVVEAENAECSLLEELSKRPALAAVSRGGIVRKVVFIDNVELAASSRAGLRLEEGVNRRFRRLQSEGYRAAAPASSCKDLSIEVVCQLKTWIGGRPQGGCREYESQ